MTSGTHRVRSVVGSLLILVGSMALGMAAYAIQSLSLRDVEEMLHLPDETDQRAPIDYGGGPGKPPPSAASPVSGTLASASTLVTATTANSIRKGDTSASTMGVFGAPITWP